MCSRAGPRGRPRFRTLSPASRRTRSLCLDDRAPLDVGVVGDLDRDVELVGQSSGQVVVLPGRGHRLIRAAAVLRREQRRDVEYAAAADQTGKPTEARLAAGNWSFRSVSILTRRWGTRVRVSESSNSVGDHLTVHVSTDPLARNRRRRWPASAHQVAWSCVRGSRSSTLRCRQDLGAGVGDQDGVFELCSRFRSWVATVQPSSQIS